MTTNNLSLLPFVFNLSANSPSPNYFTAKDLGESNLWHQEAADRGDWMKIEIVNIARIKSLHLLPFDHCGKLAGVTSLRTLVS